jgi:hypothetical protein
MLRDPFVVFTSPGRLNLSLRTLAANDNAPLAATAPPRHADGSVSTRWPLLNRLDSRTEEFGPHAANEFARRAARKIGAWL